MNANDVLIERTEVVRIHLNLLGSLLVEPPTAAQAIRASMSLRFLFDGPLKVVARQKDITLSVPAPDLSAVPIDEALIFACGGYCVGGNNFTPYYRYRQPGRGSPHWASFERATKNSPSQHTLVGSKLGSFQKLPCLAFAGNKFNRETVVRYVANKCGGAHYHGDTEKFKQVEHHLTNIGHIVKSNEIELSVIFLETLGTAWFLLNSPSVVELRKAIDI